MTIYHFHSVRWQVIEDRIRPAGNTDAIKDLPVAAQYVWSTHYVDELILIDRNFNGDTDLSDDGERLYVQQDANYNVTSVVGDADASTAGNQWGVVERYQYDPYGRREVLNADWSLDTLLGADGTTGDDSASAGNTSDVGMLHGHQGGRHDVESHLVHFRNRDLNVVLGRWTRQDPLGYVDGGSLYEYVRGGPTRLVDPWGKTAGMAVGAAMAVVNGTPAALVGPEQDDGSGQFKIWHGTGGMREVNCHGYSLRRGDIVDPGEFEQALSNAGGYTTLKPGDAVQEGDIAVYNTSTVVNAHSATVTSVDSNGDAVMVQGKEGVWGVSTHHPYKSNEDQSYVLCRIIRLNDPPPPIEHRPPGPPEEAMTLSEYNKAYRPR